MKAFFGTVFSFIGIIALGALLIFGGNFFGFWQYSFFAPKIAEVQRQTFEQSRAFQEGSIQNLQNLKYQYLAADDVHKAGLRAAILEQYAAFKGPLPQELATFYSEISSN